MKAQILTTIIASLLIMLGSCSSNPTGIRATGTAYEIIVVATQPIWNNEVGNILKEQLMAPVPGLPAPENAMRISYVQPADFSGMLTYVRNILMVTVDNSRYTKISVKSEPNRWAKGQVVVSITSPDESLLADYLNENNGLLVEFFTKIEMKRYAEVLQTTYSKPVMDQLMTKFDISLHAPSDITALAANDTTPDFFWASNNANTGRMDVVVYSFPYTDPNTFTKEYLIAMRNSILGANIEGSFPDSYMSTSPFVSYTPISLYGKYCGVLRGLWEMEGDMMGGPFVSFARLDETNNRVVVAEGFVYSPESDKKNYIRRLEASLHTLRLSEELNMTLDGPVMDEESGDNG